jgi:integrase
MAQITKRTTSSGQSRYDVRTRINGRVVTKTFTRRKDADNYATTIENDRLTGYAVDPAGGRVTVRELTERWISSDPRKRANTVGRDRSALRVHILPAIGDRQLQSLRQTDAQGLVNEWTAKLAPKTVHRTYGVLRAALTFAVNAGLIARSPCRNVKLPQLVRNHWREVTPDDVLAIVDAIDDRYRAMVWVSALLGLRWGEVAGLRVGRLDLLARTLTVAEIVTRDAKGRPVVGPPKSEAGHRTLAMPTVLVEVLAEHMARCGLTAADADTYLFPAPGGSGWSYSNFRRRIWRPAIELTELDGAVAVDTPSGPAIRCPVCKTGVPVTDAGDVESKRTAMSGHHKVSPDCLTVARKSRLGFHDLRRAAATALVLENVDLKTAQTRLGHSDPRLTLAVYAQATTEADRAAADVVGERFARGIGNGVRDGRAMDRAGNRKAGD